MEEGSREAIEQIVKNTSLSYTDKLVALKKLHAEHPFEINQAFIEKFSEGQNLGALEGKLSSVLQKIDDILNNPDEPSIYERLMNLKKWLYFKDETAPYRTELKQLIAIKLSTLSPEFFKTLSDREIKGGNEHLFDFYEPLGAPTTVLQEVLDHRDQERLNSTTAMLEEKIESLEGQPLIKQLTEIYVLCDQTRSNYDLIKNNKVASELKARGYGNIEARLLSDMKNDENPVKELVDLQQAKNLCAFLKVQPEGQHFFESRIATLKSAIQGYNNETVEKEIQKYSQPSDVDPLVRLNHLNTLMSLAYQDQKVPEKILKLYQATAKALCSEVANRYVVHAQGLQANLNIDEFNSPQDEFKTNTTPTIKAMIDYANGVASVFAGFVLGNENPDSAVFAIKQILAIANECQKQGDYLSANSIYSALNLGSVLRLIQRTEVLSRQEQDVYNALEFLFSKPARRYVAPLMEEKETPFIEAMGPYSGEIVQGLGASGKDYAAQEEIIARTIPVFQEKKEKAQKLFEGNKSQFPVDASKLFAENDLGVLSNAIMPRSNESSLPRSVKATMDFISMDETQALLGMVSPLQARQMTDKTDKRPALAKVQGVEPGKNIFKRDRRGGARYIQKKIDELKPILESILTERLEREATQKLIEGLKGEHAEIIITKLYSQDVKQVEKVISMITAEDADKIIKWLKREDAEKLTERLKSENAANITGTKADSAEVDEKVKADLIDLVFVLEGKLAGRINKMGTKPPQNEAEIEKANRAIRILSEDITYLRGIAEKLNIDVPEYKSLDEVAEVGGLKPTSPATGFLSRFAPFQRIAEAGGLVNFVRSTLGSTSEAEPIISGPESSSVAPPPKATEKAKAVVASQIQAGQDPLEAPRKTYGELIGKLPPEVQQEIAAEFVASAEPTNDALLELAKKLAKKEALQHPGTILRDASNPITQSLKDCVIELVKINNPGFVKAMVDAHNRMDKYSDENNEMFFKEMFRQIPGEVKAVFAEFVANIPDARDKRNAAIGLMFTMKSLITQSIELSYEGFNYFSADMMNETKNEGFKSFITNTVYPILANDKGKDELDAPAPASIPAAVLPPAVSQDVVRGKAQQDTMISVEEKAEEKEVATPSRRANILSNVTGNIKDRLNATRDRIKEQIGTRAARTGLSDLENLVQDKQALSSRDLTKVNKLLGEILTETNIERETRQDPLYYPVETISRIVTALAKYYRTPELNIEAIQSMFPAPEAVSKYLKAEEAKLDAIIDSLDREEFGKIFSDYFDPEKPVYIEFYKTMDLAKKQEPGTYEGEVKNYTFRDILKKSFTIGSQEFGGQAGIVRDKPACDAAEEFLRATKNSHDGRVQLIRALLEARSTLSVVDRFAAARNALRAEGIDPDTVEFAINGIKTPEQMVDKYRAESATLEEARTEYLGASLGIQTEALEELAPAKVSAETDKLNEFLANAEKAQERKSEIGQKLSRIVQAANLPIGQSNTVTLIGTALEGIDPALCGTAKRIEIRYFAQGEQNSVKLEDILHRINYLCDAAQEVKPDENIKKIREKYIQHAQDNLLKISSATGKDFEVLAENSNKIFLELQKDLVGVAYPGMLLPKAIKKFDEKTKEIAIREGRPTIIHVMADGMISANIPKFSKANPISWPGNYRSSEKGGVTPNSALEVTGYVDANGHVDVKAAVSRSTSWSVLGLKRKDQSDQRKKLNYENAKAELTNLFSMMNVEDGATVNIQLTMLLQPVAHSTIEKKLGRPFGYKSETRQIRDELYAARMWDGKELVLPNGNRVTPNFNLMNVSVRKPRRFFGTDEKTQAFVNNGGFAKFIENQYKSLVGAHPEAKKWLEKNCYRTPTPEIIQLEGQLKAAYAELLGVLESGGKTKTARKKVRELEGQLSEKYGKLYEDVKAIWKTNQPNNIPDSVQKDPQFAYFADAMKLYYSDAYSKQKTNAYLFVTAMTRANELAGVVNARNCKTGKDRTKESIDQDNLAVKHEHEKGAPLLSTTENLTGYVSANLQTVREQGTGQEAIKYTIPGGLPVSMKNNEWEESPQRKTSLFSECHKIKASILDIFRHWYKSIAQRSNVESEILTLRMAQSDNSRVENMQILDPVNNPVLKIAMEEAVSGKDIPLPASIESEVAAINALIPEDATVMPDELLGKYKQFLEIVKNIPGMSDMRADFIVAVVTQNEPLDFDDFSHEMKGVTNLSYEQLNVLREKIMDEQFTLHQYINDFDHALGYFDENPSVSEMEQEAEALQKGYNDMCALNENLEGYLDVIDARRTEMSRDVHDRLISTEAFKEETEETSTITITGPAVPTSTKEVDHAFVYNPSAKEDKDKFKKISLDEIKEARDAGLLLFEVNANGVSCTVPPGEALKGEALETLVKKMVEAAYQRYTPKNYDELKFDGTKELKDLAIKFMKAEIANHVPVEKATPAASRLDPKTEPKKPDGHDSSHHR